MAPTVFNKGPVDLYHRICAYTTQRWFVIFIYDILELGVTFYLSRPSDIEKHRLETAAKARELAEKVNCDHRVSSHTFTVDKITRSDISTST